MKTVRGLFCWLLKHRDRTLGAGAPTACVHCGRISSQPDAWEAAGGVEEEPMAFPAEVLRMYSIGLLGETLDHSEEWLSGQMAAFEERYLGALASEYYALLVLETEVKPLLKALRNYWLLRLGWEQTRSPDTDHKAIQEARIAVDEASRALGEKLARRAAADIETASKLPGEKSL